MEIFKPFLNVDSGLGIKYFSLDLLTYMSTEVEASIVSTKYRIYILQMH